MKSKLLLVFSLMLLTTCKKDHMLDCFKSAGDSKTESRSASSFTKIDLQNNVDLVIKPNSDYYIKVTAGEHLINGIITELSGNTLYIRNENRCNWMRSFKNTYTVEIGVQNIELISYYGSGDISCLDTIRMPEFSFESWNGSGTINLLLNCNETHLTNHIGRTDIHAKGFSNDSKVYINDVGTLDASELYTNYSFIRNRSTGDIKVRATVDLGIEIQYNGNIYYTGNPQNISQNNIGSGKLISF